MHNGPSTPGSARTKVAKPPASSPSATPDVQATARVATTAGLGAAGGLAGASVLAVAGAFVVRLRQGLTPDDEPDGNDR